MIKILYKLFKKQFNKIIAEEQKLSFKSVNYDYSFTDLSGVMYYTYGHAKDMHVSRYHQLTEYMRMLGHQVTDKEFQLMNEAALAALEHADPKTGEMRPKIGVLGLIHHEIKNRRDSIINIDIIYGLVALLNLSQKEIDSGGTFDLKIHEQKIEQFKKDNDKEPLAGFFLRSGLSIYLPFIKQLESELKESTESTLNSILNTSRVHIEAFQELLQKEIVNLKESISKQT